MGFDPVQAVPFGTAFLQGLLSFFSPCVLPLLPLYLGYLSGTRVDGEGAGRWKTFRNTAFFALGIAAAFFALGLGMSALGLFLNKNQMLFARIGGILVIFFGLYQLGILGKSTVLERERRLPFSAEKVHASPLAALLMGFSFSFAWTPCVGPTLSSVLLMAASAKTRGAGFLLIAVYALGFCLPFLLAGLFTGAMLDFFRRHRGLMRVAPKVGGALLVLMGVMMLTGTMNSLTGYLSRFAWGGQPAAVESTAAPPETQIPVTSAPQTKAPQTAEAGTAPVTTAEAPQSTDAPAQTTEPEETAQESSSDLPRAIDFHLTDQYGNPQSLEQYRGKVVFLNFWATWCPPCRAEMPDIQALYEKYSAMEDPEVVILGVAAPDWGSETDERGVAAFLHKNGYTYPVAMDKGGELFEAYYINSIPQTFMITPDGYVYGYVPGSMTADVMENIIEQTLQGSGLR
ncbi:MAG: redoxin domain-containing protein [Lachnospiraceae bacterium]|nr:redoxin domain-containing protein [Lachnospiraceae bacterium]